MTTQRKAKRKLSDISFDKEGAHVALVSKEQGGPANGHDYTLVLKANKFSEDFIEKMQQVRVTMELPDFLQKFFNLYYEDAKVLATMMGYVEPAESASMEAYEADSELQDWIAQRMSAFEVLKSLYDAEDISEVLSELDETEYLAMLKDQYKIEKALRKLEKTEKSVSKESDNVVTQEVTSESDTSTNAGVEKSVEPISGSEIKEELEKSMTQEVKTVEQDITVEMVEKAVLDSVQKALDEQKVALEKAIETIATYEAEKKAAIEKARKAEMFAAVKDEAKAEVLFKAVKESADEEFEAVVKALREMTTAIEQSELFVEKGASTEDAPIVQESAVAKLLKAKQAVK